ncbi:MAG: hypothetical protein Q4B30_07340 [Coriobacteriaceae bacterium]|nr:hypothetical protein [Coriobacteriaceae bacterium]
MMGTQDLRDYARLMKRVGQDESSREAIEHALEEERSARRHAPHRARYLGAVAAVLLIALWAVALDVLPGSRPAQAPGQRFALTAYAQGKPVAGRRNVVTSSTDAIQSMASWSQNDDGDYVVQYIVDPHWVGKNVKSVRYRSTNEHVALEGRRRGSGTEGGLVPEITVGGPSSQAPSLDQLDLAVTVRPTEEIRALASRNELSQEDWDRKDYLVERAAAEELASGGLEVTATFTDGSSETHLYRISPSDDFERAWERNQKVWERVLDGKESDPRYEQLYVLEQMDAPRNR